MKQIEAIPFKRFRCGKVVIDKAIQPISKATSSYLYTLITILIYQKHLQVSIYSSKHIQRHITKAAEQ